MRRRALLVALALGVATGLGVDGSITASGATGPVVNGVDPNSGSTAGGTQVAIFGSGFTAATGVRFGSNPTRRFFVADDHRIFTQSPSGAAGPAVDITVTVGGLTSATSTADQYTYVATTPRVDALDPRQGTEKGGTGVLILGKGLS